MRTYKGKPLQLTKGSCGWIQPSAVTTANGNVPQRQRLYARISPESPSLDDSNTVPSDPPAPYYDLP
ncbi:hypothetical protein WG66_007191 [Moniliophthora roreri]|nr:hypothetical protein WG66_007191 [Moniliophthora roreri]